MYLLNQTDDFIGQLTQLVREHKKTGSGGSRTSRKKSQADAALEEESNAAPAETSAADRVPVRDKDTGEILSGDAAPLLSELEAFLTDHPRSVQKANFFEHLTNGSWLVCCIPNLAECICTLLGTRYQAVKFGSSE